MFPNSDKGGKPEPNTSVCYIKFGGSTRNEKVNRSWLGGPILSSGEYWDTNGDLK